MTAYFAGQVYRLTYTLATVEYWPQIARCVVPETSVAAWNGCSRMNDIIATRASGQRPLPQREVTSDLVVVGGGLSGVCCAVTAAREGLRVTLVQDRPVLGGNASSEVRLWILGATSHMGNNNRWARENYIPAFYIGEGKKKFWRFFEPELEAWLRSQNNRKQAA